MKIIKLLLITIGLSFFSFQGNAEGLDLNPAALGCIMSGGKCLSHTGIPIIDIIFGGGAHQLYTQERKCYEYKYNWCPGPGGPEYVQSGYHLCREAKRAYYKKKGISFTEKSLTCTGSQRSIFVKAKCSQVSHGSGHPNHGWWETHLTIECDD